MKKALFLWQLIVILSLGMGFSRTVEAKDSSIMGGSLLSLGETALTFGVGFPDLTFRFDFANSEKFNFATQVKFNYNFGFPFFGANLFLTAPMRFALPSNELLSVALSLEPGFFMGGGYLKSFFLGFPLGLGLLFTLHAVPKLPINFGIEFPMTFSFEPTYKGNVFGFNMPIELFGGVEYRLNKVIGLFAKVSGGPFLFFGNIAQHYSREEPNMKYQNVIVTGSIRFLTGIIWRR